VQSPLRIATWPSCATDFSRNIRGSVLEMTAHRLGGHADHGDRIEQLAMRDAEMFAPPLYLPTFGEIDRELRALRRRPCMPTSLDGPTRRSHDAVPARPNSGRERLAVRSGGLVPAAMLLGWIVSRILRTVMPYVLASARGLASRLCANPLFKANQTASPTDRAGTGRIRAAEKHLSRL
jgi:hypothetical protein